MGKTVLGVGLPGGMRLAAASPGALVAAQLHKSAWPADHTNRARSGRSPAPPRGRSHWGAGIFSLCWAALLSFMVVACAPSTLSPPGGPDIPPGSGDGPARPAGLLDAPGNAWSFPDVDPRGSVALLTPAERDLVLHLNLARSNPSRYAQLFIRPRLPLFQGNFYEDPLNPARMALRTKEGPAVVQETARSLSQAPPMGTLEVSRALTLAAKEHALDQSGTGETGHTGRGGTLPGTRVAHYGQWEHSVGEAIAYGPASGREVVGWLLIDDGVPSRGHRRNILNPAFRWVGVAIAPHPRYGWIAVIDFASNVLESAP